MSRALLFPVESHTGGSYQPTPRTVALFFTWSDATDFINADERTLYLGHPRYDKREHGYRPVEQPSGYQEWLASLEPKHIGGGRFQVAA